MMAGPALVLGVLAVTGVAEVWHVYVLALAFGVGTAFDPLRGSRSSPSWWTTTTSATPWASTPPRSTRPASGPGRRRPADRGVRRRGGRHRLGDPDQRGQLRRPDLGPARHRRQPARHPDPRAARSWRDPRGGQLRPRAPGPAPRLAIVFFAGTFGLNFQMTSALMATEVFDKGPTEYGLLGTFMAVGSLTGALLARGARRSGCAWSSRRRCCSAWSRSSPGCCRPTWSSRSGCAAGSDRPDDDHRRQHHHAADHGPRAAWPRDGALPHDLHGWHPLGAPLVGWCGGDVSAPAGPWSAEGPRRCSACSPRRRCSPGHGAF